MESDRIEEVADAIADLGYDGIVAFDETEPEFPAVEALYNRYDDRALVQLLIICATTEDYQLNGDAQRFWREFEATALDHGSLDSAQDVLDILGTFMDADVNARLNSTKRDRLIRIFENDFDEWFLEHRETASPQEVWEELADALETSKEKKTVVLAMKAYDIARLIDDGEYLEFPADIPIPCDLQVERVARTSGITASDDSDRVMAAWAAVMDRVSDQVGRPVSLLRIDSIVWQAGQIIGEHEPDREAARKALVEHFDEVGIDSPKANTLAEELTIEICR